MQNKLRHETSAQVHSQLTQSLSKCCTHVVCAEWDVTTVRRWYFDAVYKRCPSLTTRTLEKLEYWLNHWLPHTHYQKNLNISECCPCANCSTSPANAGPCFLQKSMFQILPCWCVQEEVRLNLHASCSSTVLRKQRFSTVRCCSPRISDPLGTTWIVQRSDVNAWKASSMLTQHQTLQHIHSTRYLVNYASLLILISLHVFVLQASTTVLAALARGPETDQTAGPLHTATHTHSPAPTATTQSGTAIIAATAETLSSSSPVNKTMVYPKANIIKTSRWVSLSGEIAAALQLRPGSINLRVVLDEVLQLDVAVYAVNLKKGCKDLWLREQACKVVVGKYHRGWRLATDGTLLVIVSDTNSTRLTPEECVVGEWWAQQYYLHISLSEKTSPLHAWSTSIDEPTCQRNVPVLWSSYRKHYWKIECWDERKRLGNLIIAVFNLSKHTSTSFGEGVNMYIRTWQHV